MQQKRVADGLYSVANEAARIAGQGGESEPVTQVVREPSGRIMQAGQWLENREPGHVLNELKTYARRHPGAFLVGAAVLGVVAGRLARNAMSDTPATGSPELPQQRLAARPVPSTSELQYPDAAYASPTGSSSSDAYPIQQARS